MYFHLDNRNETGIQDSLDPGFVLLLTANLVGYYSRMNDVVRDMCARPQYHGASISRFVSRKKLVCDILLLIVINGAEG